MTLFHAFLCCLGGRAGYGESDEESDELTSLSGEMPPFEANTEPATVVTYFNAVQTTQIGPQADSGSGQDMETKAPTPDNASVATTLIENPETAIAPSAYSIQSDERIIIEDTEIFIGPPYVDKSTGRRMIELLYFTPTGLHYDGVGLDDCEFIGCESIEPKSDDDEIEALFRYDGYKFWAYVPFGYVKVRAKTNSAVSTGLT